ncbi:MAG: hypothetical protein AB7V27_11000 [Candidatus Binatia bacterium]
MSRGWRARIARIAAVVAFGVGMAHPVAAQPAVNWNAVMRALGGALDSWRLSPLGGPRNTPGAPTRTMRPTRTPTSTRPATATRTGTATRTETRTRPATRTGTPTRTITNTRVPSFTRTPRPTATPVPTLANDGQISFLATAQGVPPAQKLASALLVFPYIATSSTQDTRIELMNMSDRDVELQCFYVRQSDCIEVGFFVRLTPQQPLSWLANDGASNPLTLTAVPPFDGPGELKCAVAAERPELSAHNAIQGRALVYDRFSGETVGYDAVGFQRLSPGTYNGIIDLDGFTYEQCPDRLHFVVLTRQTGGPSSELITVPCAEDLLFQTPTETTVQLAIINEFEQVFSSSYRLKCMSSQSFSRFGTLGKSTLGTDTAHLIVRGVSSPLIGLVIDRFNGQNNTLHTTANEPFLEGGRDSRVIFP